MTVIKKVINFILKLLGLYKPEIQGDAELKREIQVVKDKLKDNQEQRENIKDENLDDNIEYLNKPDKLQ